VQSGDKPAAVHFVCPKKSEFSFHIIEIIK